MPTQDKTRPYLEAGSSFQTATHKPKQTDSRIFCALLAGGSTGHVLASLVVYALNMEYMNPTY